MKKIILKLSVFLFVVNAYAQNGKQSDYEEWKSSKDEYENFDIAKYYTPNIVRNELPISFNLNSNYLFSSFDYIETDFNNETSNQYTSYKNYDFIGNIVSNFSHYVNTRKKISTFAIGLSLNTNYSSRKTDQPYATIYSDNFNTISTNKLSVSWSNQRYFSKLFFLNYNIYSDVSYNYKQNKIENQSEESNQKQNEYGFSLSPQIGIGYGRIENVEDARQAVYIANALSKKNVLTRNLSNEEIFDLSRKISTVKNKRFLDSRLHLTDEISTVDSFFVSINLLSANGAAYFTTLYDMWQYGDLFPRKSGYNISFLAYPYYSYNYTKDTPDLGTIYYPHHAYLETDLVLDYERPFKLNWQHSAEIGGYASFLQGKEGETDFNSIFSTYYKIFTAWASYSLGYYPNTRTNIRATVSQRIWKQINLSAQSDNYTRYSPFFNIGATYYLSPYLSVAGNFVLSYDHFFGISTVTTHVKNNGFNTVFNIQFIYSIF